MSKLTSIQLKAADLLYKGWTEEDVAKEIGGRSPPLREACCGQGVDREIVYLEAKTMIKPSTMRFLTDDELTVLGALVAEEKARRHRVDCDPNEERKPAGTAGEPDLCFVHHTRPYEEKTVGTWSE